MATFVSAAQILSSQGITIPTQGILLTDRQEFVGDPQGASKDAKSGFFVGQSQHATVLITTANAASIQFQLGTTGFELFAAQANVVGSLTNNFSFSASSLPPMIGFDNLIKSVNEGGLVTYNLTRSFVQMGDTGSSVHVHFSTDPTITALAGVNYIAQLNALSGTNLVNNGGNDWTLTFAPGVKTAAFTVATLNDQNVPLANPMFELFLSNPTGAQINPVSTAVDTTIVNINKAGVAGVVTTPGSGTIGAGQHITIEVTLSDPVNVVGSPTLKMSDGGMATLTGWSGDTLTFDYVPKAGQQLVTLKVSSIVLPTGSSIKDQTGVAADLKGAANFDLHLAVDTIAPPVKLALKTDTGVSKTDKFTGDATLTGSGDPNATVRFNVDGKDIAATATADAKGLWTITGTTLGLNDGMHTVTARETDVAGNIGSASLTFTLDTKAPTVQSVTDLLAAGTRVMLGGTDVIKLNMGEAIKVTGAPVLTLNDGETAAYSAANSDLAAGIMAFNYKATANRETNDLQISAVTLKSATVTDLAGNSANFTLTANQADLDLIIDTKAPTITGVTSSTAAGSKVPLGGVIEINLTASEAITINGTPTLKLSNGGTATYDAAESDLANGLIAFDYVAKAGQNATDLKVSSLSVASKEVITDLAGNSIVLTGAANKSLGIVVDTVAPLVKESLKSDTGVSATDRITGDATLTGSGDPNATVRFNVDGKDIGATVIADAKGLWTITGTTLGLGDGMHTVTASETDAAGNIGSMSLTFTLDTQAPTVHAVTDSLPDGTKLGLNGTDVIKFDMGEAIKVTGSPVLTLNDGETATYSASGSDLASGILAFSYKATANHETDDLHITGVTLGNGVSVTDLAGNKANFTLTPSQADLNLIVDTVPTQLRINLIADDSVKNAPAGFATAIQNAADYLESMFVDDITINIEYGYPLKQ